MKRKSKLDIVIVTYALLINLSLFGCNGQEIEIPEMAEPPLEVEPLKGTDITLDSLEKIGLPVLIIETDSCVEPTADTAWAPEGMWGYSIKNATKIPGRVRVELGGAVLYDSGPYLEKTSGMTVKIRGNTSAFPPKKPYKIKLQNKADLLNRGNNSKYADKDWVLIKDEALNFKIGFKINELIGLQWTPQYMYVNVVFNGEYRGLYMLLESVKRNTRCRLNVDKSGFIYELDAYWWNEDRYFNFSLAEELNYTYKYPESDEVTEEQNDYIQSVVKKIETSIKEEDDYPSYIDVNSFSAWMLAQDILGNYDGAGSNQFYTKYDNKDESKVMMGNLWDFDNVLRTEDSWAYIHAAHFSVFYRLFKNSNRAFVSAYKKKWDMIKDTIFSRMINNLNEYSVSNEAVAFDKSILLDNARWGVSNSSVFDKIDMAKQWFETRKFWLETNIAQLDD